MIETPPEGLSSSGQARRDAMLGELLGEVRQTRRKRQGRRQTIFTGGATCLLLLTFLTSWTLMLDHTGPLEVADRETDTAPAKMDRPACHIAIVHTDAAILARYRPDPEPVARRIDDRGLVTTLVSIGRPAGLIRFDDQLCLSAPVTDAELRLRQ